MPDITPNAPDVYEPFSNEVQHIKAHRALESALEAIDTSGTTTTGTTSTEVLLANSATVAGTATVGGLNNTATTSTLVLIANRVGFGGAVPTTSSTAAPIKGIFRTAAVVGKALGFIGTNTLFTAVFSVESQIGNAIQPGDPVMALPIAALPTNCVQLGNGQCYDTNSITVGFYALAGGVNTTTVSFHVFTFDTT